ncbi:MAG: DUF1805 domain-containing protein [Firmicutes bacterium]|nr:DUF1805 domain-containing protein [Bacillota bacterium]
MITTKTMNVNGNILQGISISSPGGEGHPNMLVIVGTKGYIMCGYLNQEAAKSFGDVACVISGKELEDLLDAPVKAVLPEAEKLGIQIGMTGAQVCEIIA